MILHSALTLSWCSLDMTRAMCAGFNTSALMPERLESFVPRLQTSLCFVTIQTTTTTTTRTVKMIVNRSLQTPGLLCLQSGLRWTRSLMRPWATLILLGCPDLLHAKSLQALAPGLIILHLQDQGHGLTLHQHLMWISTGPLHGQQKYIQHL